MKLVETRFTEKQLSRWFASALVASSVLLAAGLVVAQSPDGTRQGVPDLPAAPTSAPAGASSPASPTAPPSITPRTDSAPAPRTATEVATDRAVAERVKQALATDHLTRTQPIDIEVTRGITNLSGSVSTKAIAHRALTIARATGGVTAVQDAMKIDEPVVIESAR